MSLYEDWLRNAYNENGEIQPKLWDEHIPKEQKVYEHLIENKQNTLKGTVKELAAKYNMSTMFMCGFLDGINDALEDKIEIKDITEDTLIDITFSFESLYKKMVEYKAEHLYKLEGWNNIFNDDQKKRLFWDQKKSGTIIKPEKVGRNDPCTCGSGKKYKKCCGA